MNCSQCGKTLGPAAKFCNGCGAVQSPAPTPDAPPEALICAKCQVVCTPGTKFCLACGHKHGTPLAEAEAVTPPAPPVDPEPPQDPVVPVVPVVPSVPEATPEPKAVQEPQTAADPAPQEPAQTAAQPTNLPSDLADSGPATASEERNAGSAVPASDLGTSHPNTDQGTDRGVDQGLVNDPPFPSTVPSGTSAKPYTRWAIAAVFVVLVAGLAWMALKPSAAPKAATAASTTDNGTPAQVQDASHDDRAKADSLVGPAGQGALLPAARTPDASPAPLEVAPAVAPIVAPAAVAPVATARPAEPSKPAASKPAPAKPAPQKAKPSTLNDLLD